VTKTGRSAAARRADEVIARRAVAFREREEALRQVLADYFAARERADRLRSDAEAAAQRVQRDADARIAAARERAQREAAGFEDAARVAVARMLALGESRRAVAEATGLSAVAVRAAGDAGGVNGGEPEPGANAAARRDAERVSAPGR
jgi:hypothetical protein